MIYHPEEKKVTKIIKLLAFWSSLLLMMWFVILIFHDDIKIPQQDTVIKLNMKNKINICQPEKEDVSKKSLFDTKLRSKSE
jgi:hypothetical protein